MSESSIASTVPSSFLVRIRTSITRIVPESTKREQLFGHLAREVARSRWELDDDVVDGAERIEIRVLFYGLGRDLGSQGPCRGRGQS